jgi:hypothetical protein
MRSGRKFFLSFTSAALSVGAYNVAAQINSWTNLTSGHWDEFYWSLGSLPGPTQSVFVTNSGYKGVGVFPSTVVSNPASLTVSNLQVSAPANAGSLVLLNYAGTGLPLRVRSGCDVRTNGTLRNLYSALQVDGSNGGMFTLWGGVYAEEGGTFTVTNATSLVDSGAINLTNATAAFRDLYLGYTNVVAPTMTQIDGTVSGSIYLSRGSSYQLLDGIVSGSAHIGYGTLGQMNQYGGTNQAAISVAEDNFTPVFADGNGSYHLYGGVIASNSISISTTFAGYPFGAFYQLGGSVNVDTLALGASGNSSATYNQSNGIITTRVLGMGNGYFNQSGGQTTIGTRLSLTGSFDDYNSQFRTHNSYYLSGGILNVPELALDIFGGFSQSGGTNRIDGDLSVYRSSYGLTGGFLSASNISIAGGYFVLSDSTPFIDGNFTQLGGTNSVANSLTIQDSYLLGGGALYVSNIVLNGVLTVSNSAAVSNSGGFTLGGTLTLSSCSESLGILTLSSNALLDFGSANSDIRFKRSDAISWSPGKVLVLTNWHGNTNGGGGSQFFAGTSSAGLTAAQLAQLEFVNPAGFLAGRYAARILTTGEIVPISSTSLSLTRATSQFVLTWPGGLILQSATNVRGPYSDLPAASSPFTNNFAQGPQQFFRLRH